MAGKKANAFVQSAQYSVGYSVLFNGKFMVIASSFSDSVYVSVLLFYQAHRLCVVIWLQFVCCFAIISKSVQQNWTWNSNVWCFSGPADEMKPFGCDKLRCLAGHLPTCSFFPLEYLSKSAAAQVWITCTHNGNLGVSSLLCVLFKHSLDNISPVIRRSGFHALIMGLLLFPVFCACWLRLFVISSRL